MAEDLGIKSEDQGQVLQAFSSTLAREAHVLTQHPDLLWQQMYNRLQWLEGPIAQLAAIERGARSSQRVRPWVCAKTPFRESENLLCTLSGHSTSVGSCAFSPDGKWIVSASIGTIKIWDTSNWSELYTFDGHIHSYINACAFSPEGKTVLSASSDRTLVVRDISSGSELHTFRGHTESVEACAFSPDGKSIVSASRDKTLKVWDTASGRELRTLAGHESYVMACAFSPDGKRIVSASWDSTLKVWDAASGRELFTLRGHKDSVEACAFSPDCNRIISASSDNTLMIWDAASGRDLFTLKGHKGSVEACAFSPDGKRIVSASKDNTVKVWDLASLRALRTFSGHTKDVKSCAFSPDGQIIVSGSWDSTLKLWDSASSYDLRKFSGHKKDVKACAFNPDGKTIISASSDGSLKIWESLNGRELCTLIGHTDSVEACAFSPDGKRIISASRDKTLKLWDLESLCELRTLIGHTKGVIACDYSPDGKTIVSASWDNTLKLWDVASGCELRTLSGHKNGVVACTYSPDGRLIASASWASTLKIWEAFSGRDLFTLKGHKDSVEACVFSPDGRWIVSAGFDETLRLWDANNGRELRTFKGHTNSVEACAFSPDGKIIVSGSEDKTLKVWDVSSGHERLSIPLIGSVGSVDLDHFKTSVICGDSGGNMYLLDLIGVEYGPIIITAYQDGQDLVFQCPNCHQKHPIKKEQLGSELNCPALICELRMKINPFVIEMSAVEYQDKVLTQGLTHIALANNGRLIGGNGSGNVVTWELDSDRIARSTGFGQSPVSALAISPDGTTAAVGLREGNFFIFHPPEKCNDPGLSINTGVSALDVTREGKNIIGMEDGSLLWMRDEAGDLIQFSGHEGAVTAITTLPNGRVATTGMDLKIRAWDPETAQMVHSFTGLKSPVVVMDAANSGNQAVCGCEDQLLFIWDFDNGTARATYRAKSTVLAVSGERSCVLLGDMEGNVGVFSLKSGTSIFSQKFDAPIKGGALSPDGKRGAVFDEAGAIYRFEVK